MEIKQANRAQSWRQLANVPLVLIGFIVFYLIFTEQLSITVGVIIFLFTFFLGRHLIRPTDNESFMLLMKTRS